MSVLSASLLGWLVLTTSGYWLLPERLRDAWLSGLTLAFLVGRGRHRGEGGPGNGTARVEGGRHGPGRRSGRRGQ